MKIVKNPKAIKILKIINVIITIGIIAVIAIEWINSLPNNSDEAFKITISLFGVTPLLLNFANSKIRSLYHKGDIVNKIYNKLNDQNKDKLYNYATEIYNNETH